MEYYDSIAEGYDELYQQEQKNKIRIIKNNLILKKSSNILDIGCGTGESSDFNCNVIGMDSSTKLIKIARNKFPHKKFIVEKAENIMNLKFKTKEFDYCICVSAIHHINELDIVLEEIARISKNQVFTILKRTIKKQNIINSIKQYFNIIKEIEENKDIIMFCNEKTILEKNN